MAATVASPPALGTERRIVLPHVSWETYERLLTDDEDRRVPRLTYDRGVLEIVSPGIEHDEATDTLKLVVEIVAAALGIPVKRVGSMTYRRRDLRRGFEPDGGFYVQNEPRMRGRRRLDPTSDPPPDIVIETEVTHSALDKLALFAAVGVPEVWRSEGGRVAILVLVGDEYRPATASLAIPVLTNDVLSRFLAENQTLLSTDWFRMVTEWALSQRIADGPAA